MPLVPTRRRILQVQAEDIVDLADNGIAAGTRLLDDEVVQIVDDVGVVAIAALHPVGAAAAVEEVLGGIADQPVRQVAADQIGRGDPGHDDVFDIGAGQRVASGDLDGVDAAVGELDDPVTRVGNIDIVAGPALEAVIAGAAVEEVVAGARGQRVISVLPVEGGRARAGQSEDVRPVVANYRRQLRIAVGGEPLGKDAVTVAILNL